MKNQNRILEDNILISCTSLVKLLAIIIMIVFLPISLLTSYSSWASLLLILLILVFDSLCQEGIGSRASIRPCTLVLHEQLLLLIWNCMYDPRFVYPKYRVSCSWSMSNVSFRTKQDKEEL